MLAFSALTSILPTFALLPFTSSVKYWFSAAARAESFGGSAFPRTSNFGMFLGLGQLSGRLNVPIFREVGVSLPQLQGFVDLCVYHHSG